MCCRRLGVLAFLVVNWNGMCCFAVIGPPCLGLSLLIPGELARKVRLFFRSRLGNETEKVFHILPQMRRAEGTP